MTAPSRKWKTWLGNLALLAASLLVALALIEVVLHVADIPPTQMSHQRLFVEYDSLRGWRNIPNAQGEYATDEYRVFLSYNSRGVRGPETPYAKPAGTYRIVVLGDSFVEGYSVELDQRVTEVLQRLLNGAQPSRRFEVVALGTAGYSTDQELIWLESEGLRYEPDLVVLLFHPNDIWYNAQARYWRGSKPLFVESGDTLALSNVPVPLPRTEEDEASQGKPSLVARANALVRRHSKLYWILATILKNNPRLHGLAVRAGLAEIPPEMVIDSGDRLPVPAEFTVYRAQPTPEVEHAWRVTERLLGRMKRSSERAGAEFVVFHIPLRGSIYNEEFAVRQQFGLSADGWDVSAVAKRLETACERTGTSCIETVGRFVEAAKALASEKERLYYKFDWHWNARGHRLAAEILAQYVLNQVGATALPQGTAAAGSGDCPDCPARTN